MGKVRPISLSPLHTTSVGRRFYKQVPMNVPITDLHWLCHTIGVCVGGGGVRFTAPSKEHFSLMRVFPLFDLFVMFHFFWGGGLVAPSFRLHIQSPQMYERLGR